MTRRHFLRVASAVVGFERGTLFSFDTKINVDTSKSRQIADVAPASTTHRNLAYAFIISTVRKLPMRGAATILPTDTCTCGGTTGYRRIGAAAVRSEEKLCPHRFHDLRVHLFASIPIGQFLKEFPDDIILNFRCLSERPMATKAGDLIRSNGSGPCFDLANSALERPAANGGSSRAMGIRPRRP